MQFWSASSLNLSGRFPKNDMTNLWIVKATVYGKREGFLPGLCILSNNPKNIFRQTKGYKTGVVHGIHMLQRQDMVKPETVSWHVSSIINWAVHILLFSPQPGLTRLARRRARACRTWDGLLPTCRSRSKPLVINLCIDIFNSNIYQSFIECLMESTCKWWAKAAGGCDIVLKTLQAFEVPSVKATLMVDMHGYDGWPALATVEDGFRK